MFSVGLLSPTFWCGVGQKSSVFRFCSDSLLDDPWLLGRALQIGFVPLERQVPWVKQDGLPAGCSVIDSPGRPRCCIHLREIVNQLDQHRPRERAGPQGPKGNAIYCISIASGRENKQNLQLELLGGPGDSWDGYKKYPKT